MESRRPHEIGDFNLRLWMPRLNRCDIREGARCVITESHMPSSIGSNCVVHTAPLPTREEFLSRQHRRLQHIATRTVLPPSFCPRNMPSLLPPTPPPASPALPSLSAVVAQATGVHAVRARLLTSPASSVADADEDAGELLAAHLTRSLSTASSSAAHGHSAAGHCDSCAELETDFAGAVLFVESYQGTLQNIGCEVGYGYLIDFNFNALLRRAAPRADAGELGAQEGLLRALPAGDARAVPDVHAAARRHQARDRQVVR